MKILKINWKTALSVTLLYVLLTALVVFFIDRNTLQIDTNRVLSHVATVEAALKRDATTSFPKSVALLPENAQTPATRSIRSGAAYARTLSAGSLTVTQADVVNGRTVGYVAVTDLRSSTVATTIAVITLSALLWAGSMIAMIRRAASLYAYTTTTVAKIRNIERSPLTQSYLMTKSDDRITTALNHLGETIQRQIISDTAAKENLYEFIEFFQFPIFVYDSKGAIHRANAAFRNEFSESLAIDQFSPYTDFLNFLVEKILRPDIQSKTFYFAPIQSYYQVEFNPLIHIENRYLVAMNDVTQYQQIIQSHNAFIANVSHEFKTPLTSIRGFAEILAAGNLGKKEARKYAHLISQEASRLTALVGDTLLLTRQNVKLTKKKTRLDAMIGEILESFAPQIAEKSLAVSCQLADVTRRTDRTLAHAIFKNLIENAIAYTPEGGKIGLTLSKPGKRAVFAVADTGPGLTALQQTRVFERFYRTDEGKSNSAGTGLGLAIVQKNVRELGGEIQLDSEIGAGSTFTVTL